MSFPFPPAADHRTAPGVSDSIQQVLSAASAYAAARWQLLRVETAQAGGQLIRGVLAAVGVAISGLIGYVALVFGLIAWAATQWFEGQMAVPTLIAAGVHLLLALILSLWLRRVLSGATLFAATRQEFQEDHQWLIQHQKSPH